MKYVVSYKDSDRHFIDFKLIVDAKGLSKINLQLPSWRPGRYELGNFAKNIKDFNVLDSENKKSVVLVEYPRKGIWVIGFVTGETKGEVQSLNKETLINVFIPTTPNPTSGFLLFLPKKDLIYMKMKVEDAVKMVISGGIVTPKIKK